MANIRAGIGKLARRGGRRGLLAGAAALIGFGAARLGGDARLAEATHRGTTFDIAWGTNDLPAGAPPQVGVYTSASAPTMIATNLSGPGLFGKGGPDGQYGVWGECEGANGAGVVGKVAGTALSVGVHGQASNGAAVRGDVTGPATNVGSGVVGVAAGCEFTNPSNVGVGGSGRGMSSLANKTGVLGITDGGIGVQGWGMRAGTGVRGLSNVGGGPDVS